MISLLNTQPTEKRDCRDDGSLEIVGKPWLTLQGEGPFAGTPAVFVRLAGCQLLCPACFHANTAIRMADFSTKLISEVRGGDCVLSYHEGKKRFVKRRVARVMSRQTRKVYRIDTGKITYATGEHPFLVRGRGWVPAKELRLGDKILHLSTSELMRMNSPMYDNQRNGSVVRGIQRVTPSSCPKAWTRLAGTLAAPLTVYNLEVDGTHTYVANGMVVHNCDSDYTSNRRRYPLQGPDGLLALIEAASAGIPETSEDEVEYLRTLRLIVITGGEPFRQYLSPLCWELLTSGYRVQIETNGAYAPFADLPLSSDDDGHCVDIVCSPKTPKIHPDLEPWIDAYKYVLDADHIDPDDGLPTDVLGTGLRPARPCPLRETGTYEVFLQPLDEGGIGSEKSMRNQRAAIESCMKHDYRFSFQLHKFLGLE